MDNFPPQHTQIQELKQEALAANDKNTLHETVKKFQRDQVLNVVVAAGVQLSEYERRRMTRGDLLDLAGEQRLN